MSIRPPCGVRCTTHACHGQLKRVSGRLRPTDPAADTAQAQEPRACSRAYPRGRNRASGHPSPEKCNAGMSDMQFAVEFLAQKGPPRSQAGPACRSWAEIPRDERTFRPARGAIRRRSCKSSSPPAAGAKSGRNPARMERCRFVAARPGRPKGDAQKTVHPACIIVAKLDYSCKVSRFISNLWNLS